MLKIRRPLGRLIFNMGIAIPGKTVFLIETAPSILQTFGSEWKLSKHQSGLFAWLCYNRCLSILVEYIIYLATELIEHIAIGQLFMRWHMTPQAHATLQRYFPHSIIMHRKQTNAIIVVCIHLQNNKSQRWYKGDNSLSSIDFDWNFHCPSITGQGRNWLNPLFIIYRSI